MEQNHQMMNTPPKRWLSATPLALQPPLGPMPDLIILENLPKFFGAGSDSAEDYKTDLCTENSIEFGSSQTKSKNL